MARMRSLASGGGHQTHPSALEPVIYDTGDGETLTRRGRRQTIAAREAR
jgi:hypothetical protein